MENQFESIASDPEPLVNIGVPTATREFLAENEIYNVRDLVTEFQKPEPFAEVAGIGERRAAELSRLLYEYQARQADPRLLLRFLLSRSRLFNYVFVPSVVALAHLTTHLMHVSKFNGDDLGTVLASIVALLSFDLGNWACDRTLARTTWTVGRTRILAVLVAIGIERVSVSVDFGLCETARFIAIGIVLGGMDGLRTWAKRAVIRQDPRVMQLEDDDARRQLGTLWDRVLSYPPPILAAMVAGTFGVIAAFISGLSAVLVAVVNNWHQIAKWPVQ